MLKILLKWNTRISVATPFLTGFVLGLFILLCCPQPPSFSSRESTTRISSDCSSICYGKLWRPPSSGAGGLQLLSTARHHKQRCNQKFQGLGEAWKFYPAVWGSPLQGRIFTYFHCSLDIQIHFYLTKSFFSQILRLD